MGEKVGVEEEGVRRQRRRDEEEAEERLAVVRKSSALLLRNNQKALEGQVGAFQMCKCDVLCSRTSVLYPHTFTSLPLSHAVFSPLLLVYSLLSSCLSSLSSFFSYLPSPSLPYFLLFPSLFATFPFSP